MNEMYYTLCTDLCNNEDFRTFEAAYKAYAAYHVSGKKYAALYVYNARTGGEMLFAYKGKFEYVD